MAPEMAGPLLQLPVDLYRQMRLSSNQGNLVLSPWLVACTLAMVHYAARGETAAKLARLLHASYWNCHKGALLERLARWSRDLPCSNSISSPRYVRDGLRLTAYACLYHAENIKLTDEYAAAMDKLSVHGHRKDFAFSAEQCRLSMDAFVRASTSYSIAEPGQALACQDVNVDSKLVFVSLLRQEVRWWRRFDRAPWGTFHETRDRSSTVAMMTQTAPYPVAECAELGASLVELPFECPFQSLIILLPNDVDGLANIEETLSAPKILHYLGTLREQGDVQVTLPRFSVACVTDLKRLLVAMGEGDAFSETADLTSLCEGAHTDVALSSAKHFASFEVGRMGPPAPLMGESGLADSTTALCDQEPRKVLVDRPFLFFVVNREPDMVFLLGSVTRIQ
ncbi:ipis-1-like [Amblyomma americanum]